MIDYLNIIGMYNILSTYYNLRINTNIFWVHLKTWSHHSLATILGMFKKKKIFRLKNYKFVIYS